VREGNHEAFTALYVRYRGLVDAVARSSSRDRAEDIAQEAWTSAYRALSGPGEPVDHAAPWLTTIARNVARDRHRREMRHPEVANEEIVAATPAAGGVESALEGKHNIGRLLGAYDELSEEQQVILNMREFGGLTYKQIAEQLGKPESTIEAALFRARRKMAKEYAELDSGRRCDIVQAQLLAVGGLSHRDRRRVSRHLGRCASCERVARMEGAEHLIPEPRLARIAGVIPVPAVVSRLLASGADAVSPLVAKTAVAGVAVVAAAGGAWLVTDGDGPAPATGDAAGAGVTAGATGASQQPASLSFAPNVVQTARVAAPQKHKVSGGSRGAVVAPPTTSGSTPVAAAAPSAPAPATPQRRPSPASQPVRRQSPTVTPRRPAAAAPAPQAAPAPAAPAPAAPAPAATGGGTPSAATPAPAAPAPPAQRPVAPTRPAAPSTGGGPSVTQTPTCITPDCRIQP
jgi:RNA polymerase sigma factor (sigma-70 family)